MSAWLPCEADHGSGYREFDKYRVSGSYHWQKLEGRGVRSYHARLWARYGWFVRQIKDIAPGLVLDVGCGDAALTHLVARTVDGTVTGVEPDEDGLRLARAMLDRVASRAELSHGTAMELPFSTGSVDVVLMCEVIEHLDDPGAALKEARRTLRPGGTLLLSTPRRLETLADERHFHEFDPDELHALCSRHFAAVSVVVAEPRPCVRLYSARVGRNALNLIALLGANPFRPTLRREPRGMRFCQLYAVATAPLESECVS